MRARSKVVLAGAAAFTALVVACGGERNPAPVSPAAGSASSVTVTLDAGGADDAQAAMQDALATGAPAPTASISTTGEEGPPNEAATQRRTHVFVRITHDEDARGESVDLYGDGSVWWKSPACPTGVMTRIDPARVRSLVAELERRHFFDMQPVAGPKDQCRTPGAVTVHADALKRAAERSANACSDAAQKKTVDDWKERVLAVAGEEPAQCRTKR